MNGMRILMLCVMAGAAISSASAQTPAATRLIASPSRPQPGAIVRLSVRSRVLDSIASIEGTLAGEPLHFIRTDSAWRAIGGIPTDAEGNVTARAYVRFA